MEIEKNNFDDVIEFYKAEETQSLLDQFLNQVEHFFRTNPTLKKAKLSIQSNPVKKIQNI